MIIKVEAIQTSFISSSIQRMASFVNGLKSGPPQGSGVIINTNIAQTVVNAKLLGTCKYIERCQIMQKMEELRSPSCVELLGYEL